VVVFNPRLFHSRPLHLYTAKKVFYTSYFRNRGRLYRNYFYFAFMYFFLLPKKFFIQTILEIGAGFIEIIFILLLCTFFSF
jgi:hypothetical protein